MLLQKLHHVCIQTGRYRESLGFYRDMLGFTVLKETPDFHDREYNTWLQNGSFLIELQTVKAGQELSAWSPRQSGPVHLCFLVDDVREALAELKKKGYRDFKTRDGAELYRVEGGYLFKVKAPEGTEIEIRDYPGV